MERLSNHWAKLAKALAKATCTAALLSPLFVGFNLVTSNEAMAHAASSFCISAAPSGGGQALSVGQGDSSQLLLSLRDAETLFFEISTENADPANPPRVQITAPSGLVPGGVAFDQSVPTGSTANATLAMQVDTIRAPIAISAVGGAGDGAPYNVDVVITCTHASVVTTATPPAVATPATPPALTAAEQATNVNAGAAEALFGPPAPDAVTDYAGALLSANPAAPQNGSLASSFAPTVGSPSAGTVGGGQTIMPLPRDASAILQATDSTFSFGGSLSQLAAGSAALGDLRSQGRDLWIKGQVSFLSDGSSAGLEGAAGEFNAGYAQRFGSRFAAAAQVTARVGEARFTSADSTTKFSSAGLTLGGVYALTDQLQLSSSAFYERGWFTTDIGGNSGSFGGNRYGASVGLSGTHSVQDIVLRPSLALTYSALDLERYTDSAGTAIAGSHEADLRVSAGLTVSRTFAGEGALASWTPYASAEVSYNFTDSTPLAITATTNLSDSQFNAQLDGGVMLQFANGASATLGGTYYGLGSSGLRRATVAGQLNFPLN